MNDFFPAVSVWVRFSSCSICTLHSDASYVPHPISHAYEWAHSESFVWHEKTLLAETVWHLEHYAHFLGDPQRRCDRGNYRYNCVRVCVNHIGHHPVLRVGSAVDCDRYKEACCVWFNCNRGGHRIQQVCLHYLSMRWPAIIHFA